MAFRGKQVISLLDRGFGDAALVGEDTIPASRVLLATLSPVLEARLARGSSVDATGVPAEVLKAVRAFSCGESVRLDQLSADHRLRLAAFAETYRIDSLAALCADSNGAADAAAGAHEANGHAQARVEKPAKKSIFPSLKARANVGKWSLHVAVLAAAVSMLAYAPAVVTNHFKITEQNGGFFMDDAVAVAKNPSVISETLDWHFLRTTDYWGLQMFDPTQWTHKSFRPITTLTFRWNYQLHGLNSCGFWATNVFLHAIVSVLLAVCAHTVWLLPLDWSLWAGALFAVHPVHAENLMYLVGRADILCTIFLLIAAAMYAHGKKTSNWLLIFGSLACIVLSGLCKETGFTMFGLLVFHEVFAWHYMRPKPGPTMQRLAVTLIAGTAACAWRVWYTEGTGIVRMDPMSNPMAAWDDGYVRKLSYAYVHGVYAKLMVWPMFLCYDYSMDAIPLVFTALDLRIGIALASYLAVACVGHVVGRQLQKRDILGFINVQALAIFLLAFLPMSSILFVVGTVVGERLLYIPSIAVVLLAAAWGTRTAEKGKAQGAMAMTLLAAIWGIFGVRCYYRTLDWADSETITLNDGLRQLRSSRTQFNLGNYYLKHNMMDDALVAYDRSIKADPEERDASPLWHAGQIHIMRGNFTQAEHLLRKAVNGYFSPLVLPEEEVFHDLGLACYRTQKVEEAIYYIQAAVTTNPQLSKGWNNVACAMVGEGLQRGNQQVVMEGLQAIERAIQLVPQNVLYWRNAVALLLLVGDQTAASNAFQQVMALEGNQNPAQPSECVWEFYLR